MVHICHGILCSHSKEWNPVKYNNVYGTGQHVKWNKSGKETGAMWSHSYGILKCLSYWGYYSSVVECVLNMCKVPGSITSTKKKSQSHRSWE